MSNDLLMKKLSCLSNEIMVYPRALHRHDMIKSARREFGYLSHSIRNRQSVETEKLTLMNLN